MFEIPIRNGVSIVGAIVWQASYNVRVHRGVVRVSTATDFELLLKTEIPAAKFFMIHQKLCVLTVQ